MFTQKQIDEIHDRFGSADTLPKYLHALKAIGVDTYDSFIADGHSKYYGENGYTLTSPPVHKMLIVAKTSNREKFLKQLELHTRHKTSYLEMSQGLADSGIEKWTFDTKAMTLTYYDKAGNAMMVESLL